MPNPTDIEAIGDRLLKTRKALGLSASEFADGAGIKRNTYSQWENGKGRPQIDQAIAVCKKYGLTLDWIYFGSPEGLPLRLAREVSSN